MVVEEAAAAVGIGVEEEEAAALERSGGVCEGGGSRGRCGSGEDGLVQTVGFFTYKSVC
jgi:hypothetical protein